MTIRTAKVNLTEWAFVALSSRHTGLGRGREYYWGAFEVWAWSRHLSPASLIQGFFWVLRGCLHRAKAFPDYLRILSETLLGLRPP